MNWRAWGKIMECYLANKFILNGYEVLELSLNLKVSDLDLVVKRNEKVSFVEVRFRKDIESYDWENIIDERKRQKLYHAINIYLLNHPGLIFDNFWLALLTYDKVGKKFVDKFIALGV